MKHGMDKCIRPVQTIYSKWSDVHVASAFMMC